MSGTVANSDAAVLAGDIRVLSTLLSAAGHNCSPSTTIQLEDSNTRTFSYISTLLSVSTDVPVAVTGIVTAEDVATTIVYSKHSRHLQSIHPEHPIISHPIVPSERNWEEIMHDEGSPEMGLEGDVSNFLALFAAVKTGKISVTVIIEWIIFRGWSKLQYRMGRSKTDFMDDLFDIMERWSPVDYDDMIPETAIRLPSTSDVYAKFSIPGVQRADERTTFALNKQSAPRLIKTIAQIFKYIRHTITDAAVDRAAAAASMVDSFVFLHALLMDKHLAFIIAESSLCFQLIPKKCRGAEYEIAKGNQDALGWDPLAESDREYQSGYALRYMRMLVSYTTSVLHLAGPKLLPRLAAANTTVISLIKPAACDPGVEYDRVVQMLIGSIGSDVPADENWLDDAVGFIRELAANAPREIMPGRHLHAEAGLMALACAAASPDKGEQESEDYGMSFLRGLSRVPIGVDGRWCPLCLRLGQLLNAHFFSLGVDLRLPLSETHGKLLPWDPPEFGIPASVLACMRDELRKKLVDRAIAVGRQRVSKREARDTSDDNWLKEAVDLIAAHAKIRRPGDL